ncbi:protein FANTASTIC FOUR 1-like [Olea europaea var. sylvestris]|uniref:protein FANTASTIC FOUR 1-like n=1 Tax=Olea europaea var. sylvestris TaxID=158386 RepID=UPI000C1D0D9C|nr:protein FANTASTIC FOUR 1-like [Olea europaea var. sylvestris]
MSTVVCQNLVSCFERSQQTETASLKLKVASSPSSTTVEFSMLGSDQIPEVKENLEITGWSSLQNLSSTSTKSAKEYDTPYIYPFEKRSLSEKISLELCTENLGSETGTDISDCSIFSNSYSSLQNAPEKPKKESRNFNKAAANSCRSFPPPLTTISGGSNSLQVRRHCEGGRLIIEAVETPFKPTYLQAERSDGRLRLCFFQEEEVGEENEECESESESEVEDEMIERDAIDGEKIENYEIESEQEDDDTRLGQSWGQGVDVEMGMEKFQRLSNCSRCKESGHGNKGLCNWKPPLWVAIS